MKAAFFLFLSFISICVFSQGSITLQDKPFVYKETIDTSIWNRLVSDPIFKGLSERDQQMFYWVNVFRKNPKRFYETTIREFVRQFPEANRKEVKSLEKDISKIDGPLPLFIPDAGLVRMSSIHCNDLKSRGGVISHKSSSGKDFGQRIKEAGSYRCGAENIFIGTDGSLEALIMLTMGFQKKDTGLICWTQVLNEWAYPLPGWLPRKQLSFRSLHVNNVPREKR
jgi:hypothetical protein